MADSTFHERQCMKDPATASSRIFVGSIPHENITRHDIEEIFTKFGKITGVLLNRGFAFVQFEEERSAADAIKAREVVFRNRTLDVKPARVFKNARDFRDERDTYWEDRDRERERERDRHSERDSFRDERETYRERSPIDDRGRDRRDDREWRARERDRFDGYSKAPVERDPYFDAGRERYRDLEFRDTRSVGPDRYSGGASYSREYPDPRSLPIQTPNMDRTNDCEIIVINKKQTRYAEYIEQRLKKLGLTVDILFPNEDVQMSRVLGNISSRGSLYAIMIEPTNEEHDSMTLNILHGTPEAHRNMPVNDAINLIDRNFEEYKLAHKGIGISAPRPVPVVAAVGVPAKPIPPKLPDAILTLLNLLTENHTLTVLQYDKVISYLKDRRELQVQIELGESDTSSRHVAAVNSGSPSADKQAELQSRILSILSAKASGAGSSSISSSVSTLSPVPASVSLPVAAVPTPVAAVPTPISAVPAPVASVAPVSASVCSVLSSVTAPPAVTSLPASSALPAGAWNPPKPAGSDHTSPILSDPNVQKALDSLMQGNILQRLVGNTSALSGISSGSSVNSLSTSTLPYMSMSTHRSEPLFSAYGNSNSSNHVGGRRF